MIKCKKGEILTIHWKSPKENCYYTYILVTEYGKNGNYRCQYKIKNGAIKQRYKGKRKLKPLTSYEIQQKIINSLIKTLGGEIE